MEKPLAPNARHYKRFGDHVFLTKTNVDMLLPLFMKQPYIHKVDKYTNQEKALQSKYFYFHQDPFVWSNPFCEQIWRNPIKLFPNK